MSRITSRLMARYSTHILRLMSWDTAAKAKIAKVNRMYKDVDL